MSKEETSATSQICPECQHRIYALEGRLHCSRCGWREDEPCRAPHKFIWAGASWAAAAGASECSVCGLVVTDTPAHDLQEAVLEAFKAGAEWQGEGEGAEPDSVIRREALYHWRAWLKKRIG